MNRLFTEASRTDQTLATAIALAALTGARRGELCALRWSDVDLAAGRVRIAGSLTVVDKRIHEGPTETYS
jgi:integrase